MFLRDAFRVFEDSFSQAEQALATDELLEHSKLQDLFRRIRDESRLDFFRKEVPRAIEETIHGSKRVTAIVQAIREFAHPGGSEMTHLDLNQAITSAITLVTNHWRSECEIELELEPELPMVLCHVSEINQVILNLLINACDAIAESRTPNSVLGRITFRTWLEDNCIKLSIQDTGVGIREENLDRIFTMFFTTKAVRKGTGQGLALVYSIIVERHQGTIDVISKPGEGATFLIALPWAPSS